MGRLYLILFLEDVIYVHATRSCQTTVKGRAAAIFCPKTLKKQYSPSLINFADTLHVTICPGIWYNTSVVEQPRRVDFLRRII